LILFGYFFVFLCVFYLLVTVVWLLAPVQVHYHALLSAKTSPRNDLNVLIGDVKPYRYSLLRYSV